MEPIKTPRTNVTLVGPENDESILALPAYVADGESISQWEPSDEEREQLACGGQVCLAVAATPPPPVGLIVVAPYCDCGQQKRWSDRLKMYICSGNAFFGGAHIEEDEPDEPDGSDHFRTQG